MQSWLQSDAAGLKHMTAGLKRMVAAQFPIKSIHAAFPAVAQAAAWLQVVRRLQCYEGEPGVEAAQRWSGVVQRSGRSGGVAQWCGGAVLRGGAAGWWRAHRGVVVRTLRPHRGAELLRTLRLRPHRRAELQVSSTRSSSTPSTVGRHGVSVAESLVVSRTC